MSSFVVPVSSCLQSFPTSGSFPISQLFASGGQRTGASASASVLPMDIQGWFPLGLTVLISLYVSPFIFYHRSLHFNMDSTSLAQSLSYIPSYVANSPVQTLTYHTCTANYTSLLIGILQSSYSASKPASASVP